jgi:DNA-binding winged helix-turn-helix (wHTH) protein/TolB-like protein/lipopolysaccharide biosynthesis regulator YciM
MSDKAEIFEFGQFRVDVLRRSVEREGQPVALSGKAFDILVVLLEQRGEVVDKDALMRQVWPDTAVEENNITVAISALRKALGETRASRKWIVTVPGRGYSFVGEVRCDPPTAEPGPPIAPTAAPPPRRSRTAYLLIAGALLVALSAYGLSAWLTPKWFAPKLLRSVAILPFRVLNQDSKNDYLGLGLTDAVITRLGNTQLVVRPLATVSRFAERDPIQSGRDLGVEAVVEGSVQTADNRIRVSVRLLRVRDGKPLWAQTLDVAADNAFALEDSIAERVASNLSRPLTSQQQSALNKRPTANASAYGNYLRGQYYAHKYTEDGYRKALDYLQSAIDDDPAYALAYSGLADTYYDASNLIFPPSEAIPRAKAAAQRAVALDPSLAAAHVSLGLIASKYDWNWDVAERELQAALAIDPNLATAHLWFGVYRAQLGDFNRAISELRRAQELDPLSSEINCYLGAVLYWARRYDDSINQFRQAITFDPTFVPDYVILCWALDAKGDTKAALDTCKQALERQVNPWTTLALARAQALAGDHATAAATMASLARQAEQFVSGYDRAAVYAALGRTDDAFAALEEAYQSRAEWMVYLKVDPQMDNLRRDPRYTTLLKRLGL